MRFLHTADWHLGKLFGQRYMTEDQRYVLEELIALAVDEDVQAVVIAGDVYDRAVPPAEAVALFDEVLARLVEKGIAVFYIAGNHDSAARLDFGRELLAASGVYLRGCVRGEDAPVVIEPKINSSAARPPVSVATLFSSSSLLIRLCSPSSTCMV